MREILFRGKRKDNGEWVYGFYIENELFDGRLEPSIIPVDEKGAALFDDDGYDIEIKVNPETVGQYTGLTDKNNARIFEGDICWFYGGDYYSGLWEQNAIVAITDMTDDEQTHYLNNAEYCEVIGNIFDNPELLKGSAKNE